MRVKHALIITATMFAIVIMSTLTSCSKSDLFSSSDDATIIATKNSNGVSVATVAINTAMLTGTWHVSYYFDKSVKTSKFMGYNFTFGSGTISAANGSTTHNGTWTTNASGTKFNIVFTTAKPFTELTEDWRVISQTATKLELVHVSGGNGGTDYLTFEQ